MNSSANQISPVGQSLREVPPRVTICSDPAGSLPGPDRPPPGRNMPSRRASVQGGKLTHGRAASAKSRIALRALSAVRRRFWRPFLAARKATVNGVCMRAYSFIKNLGLKPKLGCFAPIGTTALDFESANPTVVKSIKQRDLLNTWLRLYAREQLTPRIEEYQPERLADEVQD